MQSVAIKPIGIIHTNFCEKFGIPRQSGIVETPGYIRLVPPFNDVNAVRGLEEFSHIWLIWQVSENLEMTEKFSPTVRPPRLGGNTRVGVFATRSPFHPNAMGLSCVKLERIEFDEEGPILVISGADILDGTPLYDLKPYVKSGDLRPDAVCGFVDKIDDDTIEVVIDSDLEKRLRIIGLHPVDSESEKPINESVERNSISIEKHTLAEIERLIACNPRPRYQEDSDRVYGMRYGEYDVKFRIDGRVATVLNIESVG